VLSMFSCQWPCLESAETADGRNKPRNMAHWQDLSTLQSMHCSMLACRVVPVLATLNAYHAALQWRFLVSIIVASLFGLGFMAAILGYARHKRLLFIPSPVNIR